MLAAGNATIQASLAVRLGHNYGMGLAMVVAIGALAFVVLTVVGLEAKDRDMYVAVSAAPVQRMIGDAVRDRTSPERTRAAARPRQ